MKRLILFCLMLQAMILQADDGKFLTISGSGKVSIQATLADIRVGVEIEGKNAQKVQEEIEVIVHRLVTALKKAPHEKLDTSSFQIYPEYSKDPTEIRGYRGKAEVLITTKIENAGTLIQLAMESGANQINSVDIRANDDDIQAAQNLAFQKAAENGLETSRLVLDTLGLKLVEIHEVNVQANHPYPVQRTTFTSYAKGGNSLPIEGEQEVKGDVTLKLLFK